MNKGRLLRFPNRRRSREEACAWIARIDAGLDDAQQKELLQWLAESSEHAAALCEFGKLWDDMDVLDELSGLFPLKPTPAPSRFGSVRYAMALRFAPVLATIAIVAWAALQIRSEVISPPPDTELHQISSEFASSPPTSVYREDGTSYHETVIGGHGTVQLPDGTSVALNTNTRLEVMYSADRRLVVLERGEATFDVAHEPARPFDVRAGERIVRAVGTVFNVQLGPNNEIEVAVREGRVRVLQGPTRRPALVVDAIEAIRIERTLLAGDAYFESERASTLRKLEPEDIDVKLAWQRGMVIFRGEPLDQVLGEVGRYTTLEFELANPDLASVQVGGYFRVGEIDRLLVALQENFDIHSTRSGNKVILSTN